MQSTGTITSLPVDIICYLALQYLDYNSALNFFAVLIPEYFIIQHPLTTKGNRTETITTFMHSPSCKTLTETCKKLKPPFKIVAGNNTNFYFSPREGWFIWGEEVEQLTGVKGDGPQKLNLSLKSKTSQLWEGIKLTINEIVSRNSTAFLLANDGKVYQSGKDFFFRNTQTIFNLNLVQKLVDEKIIKLALGWNHILALTSNGEVYSWGYNNFSQLGLGHRAPQSTPQLITALNEKITDIFAGDYLSFCLSAEGKVYAFGTNQSGQLGLKKIGETSSPKLITNLQHIKITSIVSKNTHTLFLSEAGEVFSTGSSYNGALGLGKIHHTKTPLRIEALSNKMIKKIAAGSFHSLCIDEKGTVYSFGSNTKKQLGLQAHQLQGQDSLFVPQPVSDLEGEIITAVAAGECHTVCLTQKGEVYSFGGNSDHQLGHSELGPNKINFSFSPSVSQSGLKNL
ncbi:RCC1 domain-containing protein [Legionella clemsonensis]|uniref:Regulator of chromosome condensation (RCC1) repeat protein n=1 Tax=Legionella clemsonensis TaxID=1867846 RepID=A0A222NZH8_9GAMM|nr:hypothetical protein [Legionella clemsonensis]ASQ44992.1 Regulator of chromosome condensation (RCC1) repeat protein [Legionella clemsonensis]